MRRIIHLYFAFGRFAAFCSIRFATPKRCYTLVFLMQMCPPFIVKPEVFLVARGCHIPKSTHIYSTQSTSVYFGYFLSATPHVTGCKSGIIVSVQVISSHWKCFPVPAFDLYCTYLYCHTEVLLIFAIQHRIILSVITMSGTIIIIFLTRS